MERNLGKLRKHSPALRIVQTIVPSRKRKAFISLPLFKSNEISFSSSGFVDGLGQLLKTVVHLPSDRDRARIRLESERQSQHKRLQYNCDPCEGPRNAHQRKAFPASLNDFQGRKHKSFAIQFAVKTEKLSIYLCNHLLYSITFQGLNCR